MNERTAGIFFRQDNLMAEINKKSIDNPHRGRDL